MNLLDENFPEDQIPILEEMGIKVRQIGKDLATLGIQDENIPSLLHRCHNVTFFTQDQDFFKRRLCHRAYCLVWLDVRPRDTGEVVRRFLHHPLFLTHAKRMGVVARVHYDRIQYWRFGQPALRQITW